MSDDDLNDEPSGRRGPLPPDDRLWRHPSEIGAALAPPPRTKRSGSGPARLWLIVVVASVTGAAAALGAMVVIAAMPPRVEHDTTILPASASAPVTTAATTRTVSGIVNATSAEVAAVNVVAGAKRRSGSAVILRADGALITSRLLVESATSITVVLANGATAPGTVVGSDDSTGLAVIRIARTGLPVPVIDRASAEPGDRAIVLAGPISAGEQPWVSDGVVSSVNRQVEDADGHVLSGMIETNSPVAGSADGGALVAADGQLSGVTLVVAKGDDPNAGYAVPIVVAASVADDILTFGKARHAWLGVSGDALGSIASSRLSVPGGVVIDTVTPASPAARAGLVPGDIVLQVGATDVRSMDDIQDLLPAYRPQEAVPLTVLRQGRRLTITATLGDRPEA